MAEKTATTLVGHIEPSDSAPITDADIVIDRQARCALSLVQQLLERTGLARMLEPQTLNVIVGRGNWISFSFQMQRGADHLRWMSPKICCAPKAKPTKTGKSYKFVVVPQHRFCRLDFEAYSRRTAGRHFVSGPRRRGRSHRAPGRASAAGLLFRRMASAPTQLRKRCWPWSRQNPWPSQ